jgi:hypothetical protein
MSKEHVLMSLLALAMLSYSMAAQEPKKVENASLAAEVPGSSITIGVYYKNSTTWVQLETLQVWKVKSKGLPVMIVTSGFAGYHMVNVYRGAEAPIQIFESRPTFYLRYPGLGSGRNVVMVRMDRKKDHRELQISQGATVLTTSSGYNERDIVEVTVTPLAEGLYTIAPKTDLVGGEYLLDVGIGYDFGITRKK